MAGGNGSPARQLAERRRAHALFLRTTLRLSYTEIAESLLPCERHRDYGMHQGSPGCADCLPMYASKGNAYKAVQSALRMEYALSADAVEDYRREQAATVSALLRKTVADAVALTDPVDRARATTAAVRLLERQARLLGLDAPARVEVTEDLDRQITDALEGLLASAGVQL